MSDDEYYERNIMSRLETGKHTPFITCECIPMVIEQDDGELALLHRALEFPSWILAIEVMLGIVCFEHSKNVDGTYEYGKPHKHCRRPFPMYEYPHKKIDPR